MPHNILPEFVKTVATANLLICFYVNLQYVRSHAVTVAPNDDVDDWSFPRPRKCLAEAIKPASSSSGQVNRTPPKLSLISISRYLWIHFKFQYASIISPVSHLRITGYGITAVSAILSGTSWHIMAHSDPRSHQSQEAQGSEWPSWFVQKPCRLPPQLPDRNLGTRRAFTAS